MNSITSGTALLVIVPCGQQKIWRKKPNAGLTPAKALYTGSPFVVNRAYAEKFSDRWVILSAKYGFIDPDYLIAEDYNTTFKRKSTSPVTVGELVKQVENLALDQHETVIGLGGKDYRFAIEAAFRDTSCQLYFPFAGLPVGRMMQATKAAMEDGKSLGGQS